VSLAAGLGRAAVQVRYIIFKRRHVLLWVSKKDSLYAREGTLRHINGCQNSFRGLINLGKNSDSAARQRRLQRRDHHVPVAPRGRPGHPPAPRHGHQGACLDLAMSQLPQPHRESQAVARDTLRTALRPRLPLRAAIAFYLLPVCCCSVTFLLCGKLTQGARAPLLTAYSHAQVKRPGVLSRALQRCERSLTECSYGHRLGK